MDDKDIYFEVYISPKCDVCIIGKLDSNYISWCSITNIRDKETNASIFNYLLNSKPKIFSTISKALGSSYQEVMNWHNFHSYNLKYNNKVLYC